ADLSRITVAALDLNRLEGLVDVAGITERLEDVVGVEADPDVDVLVAGRVVVPVEAPLLYLPVEPGDLFSLAFGAHASAEIVRALVSADVGAEEALLEVFVRLEVLVGEVERAEILAGLIPHAVPVDDTAVEQ